MEETICLDGILYGLSYSVHRYLQSAVVKHDQSSVPSRPYHTAGQSLANLGFEPLLQQMGAAHIS